MKVNIHPQKIIAKNTTEPILWGGYQFPKIKKDHDGFCFKCWGIKNTN